MFAAVQAGATFVAYRGLTSDDLGVVLTAGTAAALAEETELPEAHRLQGGSPSAATGRLGAVFQLVVGALQHAIERGRRYWRRRTDDSNQAPSWSVHVSVLALLVIGGVLATPALRGSSLMLLVALAMVAGSWVNVLVAYGVHYGRLDTRQRGFSFPGGQTREFIDYLYLAMSVQTTFGTTDVSATSVPARRAVMGHSALAFVFNTVLIAMIVSLLLSSTGG